MEHAVRKKLRLENYDYSRNGAYFVTVCTKNRVCLFWQQHNKYQSIEPNSPVVGANCVRPQKRIQLSEIGKIVKNELNKINSIYKNTIRISKFVIMPNHIHMIVDIDKSIGRTQFAPTVSRVIKQFKGSVTKQIGFSPWQRSFNDHIIRNKNEYVSYWQYIENNPADWENDRLFCTDSMQIKDKPN
ncbi:MAG: transposase [Ruminococcus sp.]|nr:transposase [Ruminococcus sp.]